MNADDYARAKRAQEISYALAKQVPDMQRGFTIQTAYGEISVESGPMAESIANRVRRLLEAELKKQCGWFQP